MNKVRSVAFAAALALSAGCATTPELPETVALPQVRSFSGHPEGETLPPGWQPWVLSRFKRSTAYKLVNEFSHNSDPTSTIEHKDKSESKDAIKILLNIVKESDPKHFEILEKNLVS